MDCIFCKIISGEIPSYTLYEDEVVKVFLDVNPDSNGHMLIVPKIHTLDIDSIDNNTYIHIKGIAKNMKKLVEEKLKASGVSLIQNNGCCQEVKHYHLHLIPKYCNQKQENKSIEEVYNLLAK